LLAGLAAVVPVLLGVLPFGMIYGALAVRSGLSPGAALAMSSIVFAGSAQFVAVKLVAAGAPPPVIVLTTFILNLRHVLYSASIAPYFRQLRPFGHWAAAYFLTDEAYAVAIAEFERARARGRPDGEAADRPLAPHAAFYFGAGMTLWVTWQLSSAAGVFLGTAIPATWELDFALPLTFIALVIPFLTDRASLGAALTAGLAAVALHALPFRLGLLVAAILGIAVGIGLEAWPQGFARDRSRAP
jgi:4-azaleucine resistance transporter AzlC